MLPQDAYVSAATTGALRGVTVDYDYSRGTRYRAEFDGTEVTFAVVSHSGSDASRPTTPPPLRYLARELRPGLMMVHWIVPDAAIHVCLIFDFDAEVVHVSAMMPPNRWEFFDIGHILAVQGR